MYCSKCGKKNPDKANYCKYCGSAISEKATKEGRGERITRKILESGTPGARWIAAFIDSCISGFIGGVLGEFMFMSNESIELLGIIFIVVYLIILEGLWATTIGKKIFNMTLITKEGKKPSLAQVLMRTFLKLIPFEGALIFFKDKEGIKHRCLHDRIAGTYVVKRKLLSKE